LLSQEPCAAVPLVTAPMPWACTEQGIGRCCAASEPLLGGMVTAVALPAAVALVPVAPPHAARHPASAIMKVIRILSPRFPDQARAPSSSPGLLWRSAFNTVSTIAPASRPASAYCV